MLVEDNPKNCFSITAQQRYEERRLNPALPVYMNTDLFIVKISFMPDLRKLLIIHDVKKILSIFFILCEIMKCNVFP